MNELKGTNIAAPIVPFSENDIYPTHNSLYGKGGYREIPTLADRDAIPLERRSEGMLVYVKEDGCTYKLVNVDDNIYEIFNSGYPTSTIIRLETFDTLPSVGDPNAMYIITSSYDTYVWDSENIQFRQLNEITEEKLNITSILCGDSNG